MIGPLIKKRFLTVLTGITFLFVCSALLWPYLTTGFFFDDMLFSRFAVELTMDGVGFWQYPVSYLKGWMADGRLFPLATLWFHTFWWTNPGLLAYRIFQVSLVIGNLILFIEVITRLGGTRKFAFLTTVVLLALFQIRNYHDPITSYNGLMQLVTLLGLASAYFLIRKRFVISCLLFGCALLTYEVSLIFFPILFLIACHLSKSSWKAKSAWSYAIITATYLGAVLLLRQSQPSYAGIQLQLDWHVFRAYAYQWSGALPLSYAIFGRSGFFGLHTLTSYPFLSVSTLAVFMTSGGLVFYWLKSQQRFESQILRRIALLLMFLTPVLMAVSKRYQMEISRPGQAYLPVYVAYFGSALLITLWLSRRPYRFWTTIITAFITATVITLSFTTNRIAAEQMNREWTYPRLVVERFIESGFLDSVPENSIVLVQRNFHGYLSEKYLRFHLGKKVTVRPLDSHFDPKKHENAFLLRYEAENRKEGFVSLSKIQAIKWDLNQNAREVLTDGATKIMIHSENGFEKIGITDGTTTYKSDNGNINVQTNPLLLRLTGTVPIAKWF